MPQETGAKDRILQVTLELIANAEDVENITVRQIAEEAGVNLALINYYYQSKENLLATAVGIIMGKIIDQVLEKSNKEKDPVLKLKSLLSTTADFSFKHNKLFRVAVAGELKQGCRNSCELILPLLQNIYPERNQTELRIIALQLFLPFHNIVLYPEVYNKYLDTDFFDAEQRTRIIYEMTDRALS